MTVLEWLLLRGFDITIEAGELPPSGAVAGGLAAFGTAVVVLVWLGVSSRRRNQAERNRPEPGSLKEAHPWLAEDSTETRPIPTGEAQREAMRKPSPAARRGGVYHGQAVDDPDETQTFDAVSATTVIPKVRPARYRGWRRGR